MHAAAAPGPPAWPDAAGAPSTLRQCLTLAVLLHVLAVLVFGNTEGGSAWPGQGVWGALNIRLAGSDAGARSESTVPSDAYTGPQGQARERRWGGAVRTPQDWPDAHSSAGAARQGVWQPQATADAAPVVPADAPPATAADLPPAVDAAAQPPVQPPVPVAPMPDRAPLPARPAEATSAIAPAPLPVLTAPAVQTLPLPALNLPPAPEPPPAPPAPALPPRVSPVRPERVQGVQAPALSVPAPGPMPLPTLALPATEPPAPARNPAPRVLPAAITTPPVAEAPVAAPVATAAPAATPAPSAAPQAAAAAADPPSPSPTATAPASTAAATTATTTAPSAAGGTAAARPLPGAVDLLGRSVGAPDAGARVGHDLATAPSLPASAAQLDLRLQRPLGGSVSAQRPRGLLPVLPHPPEQASKLARDIQKAGQPDCREAYSGMGLLAVVPLVADTVRNKGCRW